MVLYSLWGKKLVRKSLITNGIFIDRHLDSIFSSTQDKLDFNITYSRPQKVVSQNKLSTCDVCFWDETTKFTKQQSYTIDKKWRQTNWGGGDIQSFF